MADERLRQISTALLETADRVVSFELASALTAVSAVIDGVLDRPENQGWQPIETAPRDGTLVLAFFPYDPSEVEDGDPTGFQAVAFFDAGDALNNAGGWNISGDYYGAPPTHWMPLLDAPARAPKPEEDP